MFYDIALAARVSAPAGPRGQLVARARQDNFLPRKRSELWMVKLRGIMPRMIHTSLLWQGPVRPSLGVCYLNLIKSCVVAAVAYDPFFLHLASVESTVVFRAFF